MLGFFLSDDWRAPASSQKHPPGLVARTINPVLTSLSKRACNHPIYTIVTVAVLASSTYLGLLDSPLFDRRISANNAVGHIAINNILAGSKKLYAGPDSDWKWLPDEDKVQGGADDVRNPFNLLLSYPRRHA